MVFVTLLSLSMRIQNIYVIILLLPNHVFSIFQRFQLLVERQFSHKIKSVQTDWGGEYLKSNSFFQTIGIHHRLIFPHTHEQNGSVELRHRHIVETGLTLLGQCSAPLRFWNYAFESSVYLINRMPTLVLQNQSPFECLFNHTPDYDFLRTFRCLCFSFLHPYHAHKLDFRSSPCVFIGYSSSHLGYRCLDLASQHIYISCHVRFHDNVFLLANFEHIAPPTSTSTQPTHLPALITSHVFHPADPPITPPSGSVALPTP
jgi:histone deacetylase 1/2